MKRKAIGFLAVLLMAAFPLILPAQSPPLPYEGNNPSGNQSPIGGGASLGGGLVTMLILGAGYGSRKIYYSRKRILE